MSDIAAPRDTVGAARRPRLTVRRLAVAGAILAVAAGASFYGHDWWTTGRFIESTDDAYVGGDVTPIAPHVAGFVAAVLVADNQHVHVGELLIRLDPRDAQAALDRAKAIVSQRVAALASLHAQSTLQDDMIRRSAADLQAKTARAAFTVMDAQRYETLARSNAGSRQSSQQAQTAQRESQSAMVSAQAALDAARQQRRVIDTQVDEAEGAIAQAQSDERAARLDLGYTEIRSPIDGFVGNRAAEIGGYVSVGTYLLSVIPAHGLWVDANFKEDQLGRMKIGQSAATIADIGPGRVLHGHVQSISPGTGAVFSVIPPENATGNFTKIVQRVAVRIALDDADGALGFLRPGLSTTVDVDTRTP